MNRLLLFLILIITGTSNFAQQRNPLRYDNHSNWFFGLNYGGTWHTSNVGNEFLNAGGFTLGKSYFYRQGSPVFFDLRGRFLVGTWEGLDRKLSYVSPNDNVLNGTLNPAFNYYASDSSVLRNFRSNQVELNLELVMHLNRLREATKWDFYLFGGLGLTFWRSRANYSGDGVMSTQYDYTMLNNDFSKPNIQNFLDNTYETSLDGSTEGTNVNWMPHVGLGIGRQLGSRVTLGIEHKTTFTRSDLWDGLNYTNSNQPTGQNDLYHYTGLYLKWYLRGARPYTPPVNNPNPQPAPCFSPTVAFTEPIYSHHTTMMQTTVVRADIRNISNRNQITVRVNGQFNSNYSYNENSGVFQSQILLTPGQNLVEITVSNNCGSVTDSRIIVFQPQTTPTNPQPQMPPPIVSITNPAFTPHTVEQSAFNLQAQVLNVTGREQIQMTVNGMSLSGFTFSNQTNQLNANLNLVEGSNTIVITATNQVGTDSKQTVIIYTRPQQLPPPVVQFVAPTTSTIQVSQPSTQVTANVFNVSNKQNITVSVNGQVLQQSGFTFNANTSSVTFNTPLMVGANTIQISAYNTVGTDAKNITVIYAQSAPQLPPVVTFIDPAVNPFNTIVASHNVSAVIQHITSQSQIQVWVNNAPVTNFSFNNSSNVVQLTTGLQVGSNTVRIKATNNAGFDDETTVIVYTPHNPVMPPVVVINSPIGNPALSMENSIPVNATVLNVETQAGVQVLVNNQNVSNFVFNPVTHQVDFVAILNPGINTVVVKGTNSAGQAQASQQINYKQVAQLNPPVVTFVNPAAAGQTVNVASFEMIATVSNVTSKEQIQLMMNGQTVASNLWVWNANTSTVSYNTSLIPGLNLFTVTGSNAAGVDSKTLNVNYQVPVAPCNPPTVVLNIPTSLNNNVQNETVNFEATLNHVSNVNQITVFLNGTAVQGWNYNSATKKINGSLTLGLGNNVAEILVNNGCGKQRVTFLYVYEPAAPCHSPLINAITPQTTQVQTQETTIAVSASTQYINNASEVAFYVNGTPVPFNFDPATKVLTATGNLVIGSNVLRFESINECGKGIAQWTVQRTACNKPVLNLSSNVANGSTVNSPDFNLSGTVQNVTNAESITVTRNGSPINFVFQSVNGNFTMNATMLEGNNTFVVTATNSCGTETFTIKATYQKPVVPTPPTVDINTPEASPYNTQEASMTVVAEVMNVTSASQIQVTVNGSNVQFSFNPASHLVTWQQTWIEGQNIVVVSAQNNDGSASDSKIVVYTKPVVVIRPAVIFTNPLETVYNTDQPTFTFTGYITNLTSVSQASAKLNGQNLSNFNGQLIDGLVYFSVPVVFDNNNSEFALEMKGQNSAGVTIGAREVHREVASADDPVNCMPVIGAVFASNHKSVAISSTKELSNVVLKFHDNTTQTFNNLSGLSGTFQGTAGNDKKCIVGVWVKSGCNQDVSGNGVGEWKPNTAYPGTCQTTPTCGVNINPGTVEWQFCMQTASGTFNTNTLNGNPNFSYQGNASTLFFVPANSGEVLVNGVPYQVQAGVYYYFKGSIEILVNKQGGAWNVCFNASEAPTFGVQNRPNSPCEPVQNPGTNNNSNTDTTNAQIGNNSQNCLPVITNAYSNGQKTVTVTSSLNLNNVVLKFHDNTTQQFNNLVGKTRTLSGTGANAGKCIIGVWVKAGCNSSNDGPNYGEYFANTTYNNECAAPAPCGPFFSLRSASWEFCLVTPAGTFNRNDLANNNNFLYEGAASSVYFYSVSGGGNVTVNGQPFVMQANRYYLFTGNVQVKVTKNDPSAPGQWMICITTNTAPVSGAGEQRPVSPCEEAGRNQNPTNPNQRPNNAPQNKPTAPQTKPNNAPQTKPNNAPQTKPNNAPQTKPNNAPQTKPNNAPQTKPNSAPAPTTQPQTKPQNSGGSGGRQGGGTTIPNSGGGRPN
jgi:hypothetical protein